ncbi:uncharacterized protein LOC144119834 [Amblyomma americanum]
MLITDARAGASMQQHSAYSTDDSTQVTSQKEKKAQKRKLSTKSCALQLKSCSSDEELIEKGALDAKPKEIEKLQFEIRSLRKKLAEEWKRNHDLQEVVVTGIGEVQEHLKKRRMCQCSEQQQVCNLDVMAAVESSEQRDAPDEGLPELAAA